MVLKKKKGNFGNWQKPNFALLKKTDKNFRANFQSAIMYAHYEISTSDLKKEVIKYIKGLDPKDPLLLKIKDIHENRFGTVGKYVYILNNGGDIPDEILSTIKTSIEKVVDEEENKISKQKEKSSTEQKKDISSSETIKTSGSGITIQDRLREKAREAAGEVEGWLDEFHLDRTQPIKTVEEFVNLFKTYELKSVHVRHIQPTFERRKNHLTEVLEDKELFEGYNYTKAEIKKLLTFYQNMIKAFEMLQEAAKVTRAPAKKKPVSQEKLVSKLKYKKEDSTLGLVSLNPVQILGSKEVWVYNTKTRKLVQFKAADERGILVKGAGLENFSSDSKEKTLRKPAETLAEFKKASKVKLRTFMADIPTLDTKPTGKLNEHHIILRIDK